MTSPDGPPRILVVVASTRRGRFADQVVAWLRPFLDAHAGLEFEIADLREWRLPYYDRPELPNRSAPRGRAADWAARVGAADGFLVVTPEYNHGYPAVLKSALDAVYTEWNRKPMAFVTYGGWSGGVRAAEQLAQVAVELQVAPLRGGIALQFAALGLGEGRELPHAAMLEGNAGRLLDQLEWWARALRAARLADASVASG